MSPVADHAGERAKPGRAARPSAPVAVLDRTRPGYLKYVLHDRSQEFRIVITGDLAGSPVQSLEWAWETAKSILKGRAFVVDISGITTADRPGCELLRRMRESGARVTPALELRPGRIHSPAVPTPAQRLWRQISCGRIRAIVLRLMGTVFWW